MANGRFHLEHLMSYGLIKEEKPQCNLELQRDIKKLVDKLNVVYSTHACGLLSTCRYLIRLVFLAGRPSGPV